MTDSRLVTAVAGWDAGTLARRVAWVTRVGLIVSFVVALGVPLDQLDGKGMGFRAPFFLASIFLIPLLSRRRGLVPMAFTADALVVSPFLLDTLGNLLGFYDRYVHTDDVLHALNWFLLIAAFHAFRFRRVSDTRDARLLGAAIGGLAIVGWEIAEWAVAETGAGGGLALTYADTVGDLALSTSGGIVGSLAAVALLGPRRSDRGDQPGVNDF